MKHLQVAAISTVLVLNAGMAMRSAVIAGDADDPSRFTYARLYCTSDGETHFQNVTVDLWRRLQVNGRDFIAASQSMDAVRGKLRVLMNV